MKTKNNKKIMNFKTIPTTSSSHILPTRWEPINKPIITSKIKTIHTSSNTSIINYLKTLKKFDLTLFHFFNTRLGQVNNYLSNNSKTNFSMSNRKTTGKRNRTSPDDYKQNNQNFINYIYNIYKNYFIRIGWKDDYIYNVSTILSKQDAIKIFVDKKIFCPVEYLLYEKWNATNQKWKLDSFLKYTNIIKGEKKRKGDIGDWEHADISNYKQVILVLQKKNGLMEKNNFCIKHINNTQIIKETKQQSQQSQPSYTYLSWNVNNNYSYAIKQLTNCLSSYPNIITLQEINQTNSISSINKIEELINRPSHLVEYVNFRSNNINYELGDEKYKYQDFETKFMSIIKWPFRIYRTNAELIPHQIYFGYTYYDNENKYEIPEGTTVEDIKGRVIDYEKDSNELKIKKEFFKNSITLQDVQIIKKLKIIEENWSIYNQVDYRVIDTLIDANKDSSFFKKISEIDDSKSKYSHLSKYPPYLDNLDNVMFNEDIEMIQKRLTDRNIILTGDQWNKDEKVWKWINDNNYNRDFDLNKIKTNFVILKTTKKNIFFCWKLSKWLEYFSKGNQLYYYFYDGQINFVDEQIKYSSFNFWLWLSYYSYTHPYIVPIKKTANSSSLYELYNRVHSMPLTEVKKELGEEGEEDEYVTLKRQLLNKISHKIEEIEKKNNTNEWIDFLDNCNKNFSLCTRNYIFRLNNVTIHGKHEKETILLNTKTNKQLGDNIKYPIYKENIDGREYWVSYNFWIGLLMKKVDRIFNDYRSKKKKLNLDTINFKQIISGHKDKCLILLYLMKLTIFKDNDEKMPEYNLDNWFGNSPFFQDIKKLDNDEKILDFIDKKILKGSINNLVTLSLDKPDRVYLYNVDGETLSEDQHRPFFGVEVNNQLIFNVHTVSGGNRGIVDYQNWKENYLNEKNIIIIGDQNIDIRPLYHEYLPTRKYNKDTEEYGPELVKQKQFTNTGNFINNFTLDIIDIIDKKQIMTKIKNLSEQILPYMLNTNIKYVIDDDTSLPPPGGCPIPTHRGLTSLDWAIYNNNILDNYFGKRYRFHEVDVKNKQDKDHWGIIFYPITKQQEEITNKKCIHMNNEIGSIFTEVGTVSYPTRLTRGSSRRLAGSSRFKLKFESDDDEENDYLLFFC